MSLHINRFVDRIKAADSRKQHDFTMSMADAKDLHADITKLLLVLHTYHKQTTSASNENNIEVDGGSF